MNKLFQWNGIPNEEKVVSDPRMLTWLAKMQEEESKGNVNGTVEKIEVQGVDMFGPTKVGFIKFTVEIKDKVTEKKNKSIVFMRGGAVTILIVLICNGKKYVLTTLQRRWAIPDSHYEEIPAGMLDGSGNFLGVATKELEEETGININKSDLVDLGELVGSGVFYPSPGACDEFMKVYLYQTHISDADLTSFQNKLTGNYAEGESITLNVRPLEEIVKLTDSKALVAYTWYQEWLKTQ